MAWIESHQSLKEHPKTYRLASLLKRTRLEAIGILHCLWWWALDAVKDGDLSMVNAEMLADVCLFKGDPNKLLNGLKQSGWIDDDCRIHHWQDYIGRLLEKREQDRTRKTQWRKTRTRRGRDADGGADADADKDKERDVDRTRTETGTGQRTDRTDRTVPTNTPPDPPQGTNRVPAAGNSDENPRNGGGGKAKKPETARANGAPEGPAERLEAFYRARMQVVHGNGADVTDADRRLVKTALKTFPFEHLLGLVYVLVDVLDDSAWEAKQGRPLRFVQVRHDQLNEKLGPAELNSAMRFAMRHGVIPDEEKIASLVPE